ncbi:hypothetical protein JXM83_01535 [Candidatus Woesearchaeota archaeon]|nr:hypothetical protein [Candidatus Woesearchaeota archaeon]
MLETLLDVLDVAKDDIISRIGSDNISHVILYGSFCYQDLKTRIADFENLNGSDGLLDKKPDFIVVVNDLYSALIKATSVENPREKVNETLNIVSKKKFSMKTPFYFNSSTKNCCDFDFLGESNVPYKVGIISQDDIEGSPEFEKDLAYLAMRLSKPVNIFDAHGNPVDMESSSLLIEFRDFIFNYSLNFVGNSFTSDEMINNYVNTYRFEKYRIFDIIGKKHLKILNSQFFDVNSESLSCMQDVLREIVFSCAIRNPYIDFSVKNDSFKYYITDEVKDHFKVKKSGYGLSCINASMKNGVVNSLLGNQSNSSYLLRKFGIRK